MSNREREWGGGGKKASVVNTLVTALWPRTSSVRMWNVVRRGVTFRSTFLVPDIRCQLHFRATLCATIHHNALLYSRIVSLSDERVHTYCRCSPPSSLFTHDDTRSKSFFSSFLPLPSVLWFKVDIIYFIFLPGRIPEGCDWAQARFRNAYKIETVFFCFDQDYSMSFCRKFTYSVTRLIVSWMLC